MIAVVIGSTGLIGSILIKKLLADESFHQVISVSRSSLHFNHPKLKEVLVSNLENLWSLKEALHGDLYFCCLGTTIKTAGSQSQFRKVDHDAVVEFGKIAQFHEAKSFAVVSAMGANSSSFLFYNQVKGDTENSLRALRLRSLIIYRPAFLVGPRKEFRLGEKVFSTVFQVLSVFLPKPLRRRIATGAEDLAEKMLEQAKVASPGTKIIEAKEIEPALGGTKAGS